MTKHLAIPEKSRTLVRKRAHQKCERCWAPAPKGQWHHRRRRGVVDEHTHCPCNGVWLCPTCHRNVHATPVLSREHGWIVTPWNAKPATTPLRTPLGWVFLDCEGAFEFTGVIGEKPDDK